LEEAYYFGMAMLAYKAQCRLQKKPIRDDEVDQYARSKTWDKGKKVSYDEVQLRIRKAYEGCKDGPYSRSDVINISAELVRTKADDDRLRFERGYAARLGRSAGRGLFGGRS
jgi:hypothetical protein